jgi:hypothetical protein
MSLDADYEGRAMQTTLTWHPSTRLFTTPVPPHPKTHARPSGGATSITVEQQEQRDVEQQRVEQERKRDTTPPWKRVPIPRSR